MRSTKLRKTISILLSSFMIWTGVLVSSANAGVISSADMLHEQYQFQDKQSVKEFMARDEVKQELVKMGVSPVDVDARLDAMTPAELAELNKALQDAPAGAGIVGLVVLIFVIFVITDIIGATDIFPFIHPVR